MAQWRGPGSIRNLSASWPLINYRDRDSFMKVRLVLLELSAILALPAVALAQIAPLPDGSNSSVTCAPLAPVFNGTNVEPSSAMSEMCTAADPGQSKTIGVHNHQDQLVVGDKLREHP
jgi:hypothetical protein